MEAQIRGRAGPVCIGLVLCWTAAPALAQQPTESSSSLEGCYALTMGPSPEWPTSPRWHPPDTVALRPWLGHNPAHVYLVTPDMPAYAEPRLRTSDARNQFVDSILMPLAFARGDSVWMHWGDGFTALVLKLRVTSAGDLEGAAGVSTDYTPARKFYDPPDRPPPTARIIGRRVTCPPALRPDSGQGRRGASDTARRPPTVALQLTKRPRSATVRSRALVASRLTAGVRQHRSFTWPREP